MSWSAAPETSSRQSEDTQPDKTLSSCWRSRNLSTESRLMLKRLRVRSLPAEDTNSDQLDHKNLFFLTVITCTFHFQCKVTCGVRFLWNHFMNKSCIIYYEHGLINYTNTFFYSLRNIDSLSIIQSDLLLVFFHLQWQKAKREPEETGRLSASPLWKSASRTADIVIISFYCVQQIKNDWCFFFLYWI